MRYWTLLSVSMITIISTLYIANTHLESDKCLSANEIDPDSSTGSHLTIKIVDETDLYYVTGAAWDHLNHSWEDMDFKVIDKARAPNFVTKVDCPK